MEQKNVKLLLETPLFTGVAETELAQMLGCLAARRASYARGETILHAGDLTAELGVLLSGEVHLERTDAHGNRELVGQVHAGGIFAEVFACLRDVPLSVTDLTLFCSRICVSFSAYSVASSFGQPMTVTRPRIKSRWKLP